MANLMSLFFDVTFHVFLVIVLVMYSIVTSINFTTTISNYEYVSLLGL